MAMQPWVRLPVGWIESGGLTKLTWGKDGLGSKNVAGLMVLMAIAHHADSDTGVATITYDQLEAATGLSRSKVSNGLDALQELGVIVRAPRGRSTYGLVGYEINPWGRLPAKRMYKGDEIVAFKEFKLRAPIELNALKIYYLITARRDWVTNIAFISWDKIVEYTGIRRERIKSALSFLVVNELIQSEQHRTNKSATGVFTGYRLVGIDPYRHAGTTGRSDEEINWLVAQQLSSANGEDGLM